MTSSTNGSLSEIIHWYGQLAEVVTRREMERFVEEIRQRWDPPPHEEEYRQESWTDEGAFTRCIYHEAFYARGWPELDQSRSDLCAAELDGQVQFKPELDEIMKFLPKTLAEPLPQNERTGYLNALKKNMQEQLTASGLTSTNKLKLPSDLEAIFSTVNGIRQAGVPTEAANPQLVYPLGQCSGSFAQEKMPSEISHYAKDGHFVEWPAVALKLGSGDQQRKIYYVL